MGQKHRVSEEKRIEITKACIERKLSLVDGARLAGVTKDVVREWVLRYQQQGEAGLKTTNENRSYSPELKEQAVREYLSGNGSQREIAAKYDLKSPKQLQTWIKVYNTHGEFRSPKSGGSYMRKGRKVNEAEKLEIVLDCLNSGKDYTAMADKYQVSYQQVRGWTLRYIEMGASGLEDRRGQRKKDQEPRTELEEARIEIERLKHKLYLAEMERDLLKKADEIERRDVCRK